MSVGRWLNRTLQVWRQTTTPDGAGGQVSTWVMQGEVRAKVDQPSAADRMLAQQAGSNHTHSVYLLATADVQRGDQLRAAGQTLTVHAALQPSGPRYTRADCELTQRGT
ncbi:phage head closure protein [Streptomyces sp. WI03-5b]|uniref:phage head closure protein n=1 Tax=Streptomyces sp. WI03-5b TaxID=462946 RepID=UPI0029AEBC9D|nr:phage head closure protein [Streptomyces sp. WI03-5b]MDX2623850.1 phage head closure protein [Streptomyces sp. WI03-5b]